MSEQLSPPAKPSFLTEPFEWVYIPKGTVTLAWQRYAWGDAYPVDVDSFYIAKYPITNAQFTVYVNETGRESAWCGVVWDGGIDQFADKPIFKHPLHPLIDVRWHEAMLFCEWVSAKAGYIVSLPTVAQWQRAAQGDDDRKYPWGNEWDSSKANTHENGIPHTTPVTQYPEGASPYGVMDMVGNVFEWCLTDAHTGKNTLNFEVSTEPQLTGDERIFKGASCSSTGGRSADVRGQGETSMHFHSYLCGIRLMTAADPSIRRDRDQYEAWLDGIRGDGEQEQDA